MFEIQSMSVVTESCYLMVAQWPSQINSLFGFLVVLMDKYLHCRSRSFMILFWFVSGCQAVCFGFLSPPWGILPVFYFWREMIFESSFRNGLSICTEPQWGLAEVLVTLVGRSRCSLKMWQLMQKYHLAEYRRGVGQYQNLSLRLRRV